MVISRADVELISTGAPVGAEIRGVDLSQEQPGDVIFRILTAFAEHQVLIFRDQNLELEDQLRVAEWFGPRYVPSREDPLCEDVSAPVSIISNVDGGILGH